MDNKEEYLDRTKQISHCYKGQNLKESSAAFKIV